jgi:transposase
MGRKSEYSQEFQDNAVKKVIADGMGYAAAARQLGITPAKLRSWVHKWNRDSKLAIENGKDSTLQELLDLRRENEELREANEILKKAAAYFAKSM